MDLKLIAWIKDGEYRLKILNILSCNSYLSSELADELKINRASMSRILKSLKEKSLVFSTSDNSRTKLYTITEKGASILEKINNDN